ncbi:MAG: hypothetical protein ACLQUY_17015 [Ktedonobacterales bacterium]
MKANLWQASLGAVRAYHGLVVALEAQGLAEPARRFRTRERTVDRQRLRSSPRTWFAYGFYSLLNLISGQGEEPGRIFIAYAIIISLCSLVSIGRCLTNSRRVLSHCSGMKPSSSA